MIRGKKNYLPSTQLAMGFCFFFRLSEESIENHLNDRKVKYVETDEQIIEEQDEDNKSAFPDTKIKLDNKSEKDENTVLEAMKPRVKMQKKLKISKPDKKSNEKTEKQQPQKTASNKQNKQSKNKKGKGKKNKNDEWSDDEDKIKIKLEKKLEKDNRLMDLDDQFRAITVDDDLEDEELDDQEEINKDIETKTKELNEKASTVEAIDEQDGIIKAEALNQNESSDEEDKNVEQEDEEEEEEEEEETSEERREVEYLKLVNSLTGQPLTEDILLYCIPVVAPYSAVVNCKYKVKVLPGSNRRGKSAKTALHLFTNDKRATNKERDLIRSMKDQDFARNLPNHLKITAQHLTQVSKQRKK